MNGELEGDDAALDVMGDQHEKPRKYARTQDVPVKLVGEDGNVFNIVGKVSQALKRAGFKEEAEAYSKACFACVDYNEVLGLTCKTVDVR